ncbi:hypothetical protein AAC387_Pa06g2267 [Persea americana]
MQPFAMNPWYLLLVFIKLLILLTPVHPDHLANKCSDGRPNYTLDSTFDTNLHNLISTLSENGPTYGFYNSSTGESPNRVHGLVLCRGDITTSACQSCLVPAVQEVIELCPNRREAIIWYPECFIRYSDREFFGIVDINSSVLIFIADQNISQMDDRGVNFRPLMYELAEKTTVASLMYAVESESFGKLGTRYGLMQCTRDLRRDDCRKCLEGLMKDFETSVVGERGWRILGASCNIRYEDYKFYEEGLGIESPSQGGTKNVLKVALIASLSSFIGLVIMGFCIYYWRYWRKRPHTPQKDMKREQKQDSKSNELGMQTSTSVSVANMQKGDQQKTQDFPSIDFYTLQAATNKFSIENKLGEGGFGPVYKGILHDGKEIAIKRLSTSSVQGVEEFKNEIGLIANLQHRNLVKLLYCCIEREEKLIIYEYMPNTSLDVFLFDDKKRAQLDWRRRQNIVVGIARGLLYLHEDSRLRIIHRDLKASNILLDTEMNPKISDFGLARIFGGNGSEANTNRVVGTYGYMAPEYAMEGLFSVKSDVFSFGVLVLEILSGRKNNRFYVLGNAQSLLQYTWRLWNEGRGLEVLDPLMLESCSTSEALRWIHIGLLCVQEDAADRPTMSTIVVMLGSENVTLPQPTRPAFSVGRGVIPSASGQSSSSAVTCSVNEITVSILEAR